MLVEISWIGLGIIIVSWIVQFIQLQKKNKELQPSFCILQGLGIVLLVIDSFINGLTTLAILNLLSAGGALICLIAILKK